MNQVINELREGYWEGYYKNGQLWFKGNYLNDKMIGYWEFYYSDGELRVK